MNQKQDAADADMASADKPAAASGITLIAKWAKERIALEDLNPETTIGAVKEMIKERTNILPKRQKLVGLVVNKSASGGSIALADQVMLSDLKVRKLKGKTKGLNSDIVHEFILMGTPEEEIFVDPSDRDDLPDVIDDFDLDLTLGAINGCNISRTGRISKNSPKQRRCTS